MKPKTLLNRLMKAYWCCAECGAKYGKQRVTDSTWHAGRCDVCFKGAGVTETRDFNSLRKGKQSLYEQVEKEKRKKRKEKMANSKTYLQEKADTVFSRFIRKRDADISENVKCCTCPKILHWKDMTCGHWISRKVLSIRYDESNCHPQCWGCQAKHLGNGRAHKHELYIVDRHGAEERDRLLELSKIMQPDFDYQAIINKYS